MENAIWRPFLIDRQSAERLELALDAGAIVGTWLWDRSALREPFSMETLAQRINSIFAR